METQIIGAIAVFALVVFSFWIAGLWFNYCLDTDRGVAFAIGIPLGLILGLLTLIS